MDPNRVRFETICESAKIINAKRISIVNSIRKMNNTVGIQVEIALEGMDLYLPFVALGYDIAYEKRISHRPMLNPGV